MSQKEYFQIEHSVSISAAGVRRLHAGHLWIYERDVVVAPKSPAPIVRVLDGARNTLGYAFYSPVSSIRLRMLRRESAPPTIEWLRERILLSIERRRERMEPEGACRLVFGEADLLPSVVVDRYGDWLVLQTLSSGAEAIKSVIVDLLQELVNPAGILERNDVRARSLEGLQEIRGLLWGKAPEVVRIKEKGVAFTVDLMQGQKTGFFLDQRDNRIAARNYASGRCLDCFTNTGGFALHMAPHALTVVGVDSSPESIGRARSNAELNGTANVDFLEGNVFDYLREQERAGRTFHTICLDPPAFAKHRSALPAARGGYKEINLRAMKLLEPEGVLITSSCSYHLSEAAFFQILQQAAHDAHRSLQLLELRSQGTDHPILLGVPETHYLKCFILRVLQP